MDTQVVRALKPFTGKRLLTLVVAGIVLPLAAWIWGERIGSHLLPFYRWGFQRVAPHYQMQSLLIEQANNGEPKYTVQVQTSGLRYIGGTAVPRGYSLTSSTLVAHSLQPAMVLYLLLLIWPVTNWRHKLRLFALSIPILALIALADIPLVLLGALEDVLLFNLDPGEACTSFSVQWMHLMNGGGRLALGVAGFALVAFLGHFRNVEYSSV